MPPFSEKQSGRVFDGTAGNPVRCTAGILLSTTPRLMDSGHQKRNHTAASLHPLHMPTSMLAVEAILVLLSA